MSSNQTLNTTLAGFHLDSCLMNASGVHCTDENELSSLLDSNVGALVTKSCTLEARIGNPLPRYADIPNGSINSMGLPNHGLAYYLKFIEKCQHLQNKIAILSIAGLSKKENLELLKNADKADSIKLIELNLSCPNIPGKPQTGYDFDASEQLLTEAFEISSKSVGVKLPPYFDMVHFESMATVLKKFPVAYVCCVNSIGNALWVDVEKESVVIKPKNGFGGLGGMYIKPTALANVRMFYNLLDGVDIIGCGGIQNGQDAFEHILCGASMVQIGTTLWQEGPACFDRISNELSTIMHQKGYATIDEFKGKLKSIN
jgi:dihydroorotate dehydrogenase (fumarate)